MESLNTETIIQRKTVASDASPSYTKYSQNTPHSLITVCQ